MAYFCNVLTNHTAAVSSFFVYRVFLVLELADISKRKSIVFVQLFLKTTKRYYTVYNWLTLIPSNQLAVTIFGRCKQYTIDTMLYFQESVLPIYNCNLVSRQRRGNLAVFGMLNSTKWWKSSWLSENKTAESLTQIELNNARLLYGCHLRFIEYMSKEKKISSFWFRNCAENRANNVLKKVKEKVSLIVKRLRNIFNSTLVWYEGEQISDWSIIFFHLGRIAICIIPHTGYSGP